MLNSPTSQSSLLSMRNLLLLLSAFASFEVAQAQKCTLCESIAHFPKRWDCILETEPVMSCRDLYFELAGKNANSNQCRADKQKYQETCCANYNNGKCKKKPTSQAKPSNTQTGDQPNCKLCGTDEYPGLPNNWINARYVGSYSCGQLYSRGNTGLIPSFMCGALQDYAKQQCGCGEFNPDKNTGGGNKDDNKNKDTDNNSGACPSLNKNPCKDRSDCEWSNNKCSVKGSDNDTPTSTYNPPASDNSGSCSSLSNKNNCKSDGNCKWKSNKCIDKNASGGDNKNKKTGTTSGGDKDDKGSCSSFKQKDDCKKGGDCKWKDNKCRDK